MTTEKATKNTVSVTQIKNCARCGEDHDLVEFSKFKKPIPEHVSVRKMKMWTHWAMCPKTNEPILLLVKSEVK